MFDSTIRLKQLNQNEISGYVLSVVGNIPITTGNLTGAFYPLLINPSGYIGTGVTGQFANASTVTTAINSSAVQTLIYVANNYLPLGTFLETSTGIGAYFFLANIQSGVNTQFIKLPINLGAAPYITTSLTNSTTGDILPYQVSGITNSGFSINFSDFTKGTGFLLTTFAAPSNTGFFTTSILTSGANFQVTGSANLSTVNLSGVSGTSIVISGISVVIAGGSANTGQLTGVFYPLTGNPSGFITTSQTGNFASTVNLITTGITLQNQINIIEEVTGNVVFNSQTGAFYPKFGNPSGFITTGQTGAFGGGGGITTGYASGNSYGLYLPPLTITGSQPTGSYNLDWSQADHFDVTLSGNTIFNFLNTRGALTIIVATHDTGMGYSVTFPTGNGATFSSVKWPGGTGFIPIQTSGQTDIYTFTQLNSGIFANVTQNF